jgi:outer membrane lipoprotein LolB
MKKLLLIIALGSLLSACSVTPLKTDRGWQSHIQQVLQMRQFLAQGRLAYRSDNDGVNANFSWTNNDEDFALKLSGPFGASAVTIEYAAGKLYLSNQKREEFMDWMSPTEVLFQHTGLYLPVDALSHWVTGIPVPDSEHQLTLNPQQLLSELHQGGWTIHYTRYVQVGDLFLPDRITLTQDDIRIRLVIDQWSI